MPLRPDQESEWKAIEAGFTTASRHLLVRPTGTGKTYSAAHYMASRDMRFLFAVHRDVLAHQTLERLSGMGLDPGIMTGKVKRNIEARIVVGTVQTLSRWPEYADRFDRYIIDEAHRGEHMNFIGRLSASRHVIGLTATPTRARGGLGDVYQKMVVGMSYSQAAAAGVIVRPQIYAPLRPNLGSVRTRMGEYVDADLAPVMHRVMDDVIGAYEKLCAGLRTLIFAVNTDHAKAIHAALDARGHMPMYIDGTTPHDERASILFQWKARPRPLVNIGVFAEGYDEPTIEAVLLANPMRSLARYLQCAGRGCRSHPGKTTYRLVDCTGSVFEHGSPAVDREWSLERGVVRRASSSVFHVCKQCFAVYEGSKCELCGYVPQANARPVKTQSADLVALPDDFQPAADEKKPTPSDPALEMTDLTRLRRRLYAELSGRFREPMLTPKVKELMVERVGITWRGRVLVVPKQRALLW